MLDKSGVVTISEHNSALSEHEIDLMHASLNSIRKWTMIQTYPKRSYLIVTTPI